MTVSAVPSTPSLAAPTQETVTATLMAAKKAKGDKKVKAKKAAHQNKAKKAQGAKKAKGGRKSAGKKTPRKSGAKSPSKAKASKSIRKSSGKSAA